MHNLLYSTYPEEAQNWYVLAASHHPHRQLVGVTTLSLHPWAIPGTRPWRPRLVKICSDPKGDLSDVVAGSGGLSLTICRPLLCADIHTYLNLGVTVL